MRYTVGDVIILKSIGMCIYIGKFDKLKLSIDGQFKLVKHNVHVYMPLSNINESDNFMFDFKRAFEKSLVDLYFSGKNIQKIAYRKRKYALENLLSTHNNLIGVTEGKSIQHGDNRVFIYYSLGDKR